MTTLITTMQPDGIHVWSPDQATLIARITPEPFGWGAHMEDGSEDKDFLSREAAEYWVLSVYLEQQAQQTEDDAYQAVTATERG